MKKLKDIRDDVEGWNNLKNRIEDTLELSEMDDESMRSDLESELTDVEQELSPVS